MSISPSSGKRGFTATESTSVKRNEVVQRQWTFLETLAVKALRIFGEGGAAGQMLVAKDDNGNVTFSSTLPATTLARTGGTITETSTLIDLASGEYVATVYAQCTTAGAAGTLTVTFSYTDDVGATTTAAIVTLVLTGTGRAYGTAVLRCSGGGVDYTFSAAGVVGSPVYSVHLSVSKVR